MSKKIFDEKSFFSDYYHCSFMISVSFYSFLHLLLFTMLPFHSFSLRFEKRIVLSSDISKFALRCLSTPRPRDIEIPLDKIDLRYSRSSGPGGQNVNKLNTKVDIRFNVASADWLPQAVRDRITIYNPSKINKEGDIIVTSQESR